MSLLDRMTLRPAPRIPPGLRVYAIGDVHGRYDLMTALIALIEADNAAREVADTRIIFLGDLIDRGPDSAGVIDHLLTWKPAFARVRCLLGNHEEAMLNSLTPGSTMADNGWLTYGGRETMLSYGAPGTALFRPSGDQADALRPFVPDAHIRFLSGLPLHLTIGDYLFVHAGIRPGVPLEQQTTADLCWIRAPFLESTRDHGVVVIHGHTITAAPDFHPNRIGIDTGAYRTHVLTALGLEGTMQWTLQTGPDDATLTLSEAWRDDVAMRPTHC